jgi:hypothetical protein
MGRPFGIATGRRLRGEETPARFMRDDTLRIDEIQLSTRHSPFAQMMIDLAAVVSIVVLSCVGGVGLAAAGFILLFVGIR